MNIEKVKRQLDQTTIEEMDSMTSEALKEVIFQAEVAQKEAKAELEANPKYRQVKNDLSTLQVGLREVNKRQRAKIAYALHRLEEQGRI